MNKFSWRRIDEAGREVVVELWFEKGETKMLRLITYYKVGNEEKKIRTDFPNDGSPAFRDAIKKEMKTLKQYVRVIQMLARELEDSEQQEQGLEGLAYTAQMVNKKQT